MNKISISIKQHTPIIHFQYNQDGATLRASEVKPKLDKFILAKLGKGIIEDGQTIAKGKNWLIGDGEHPSLDYKVKISVSHTTFNEIEEGDKFPCFFANMGEEYRKNTKGFLMSGNPLRMDIFCANSELLKIIKEASTDFFFNHNFGTRQSKGFGSFFPEGAEINVDYPYFELPFSPSFSDLDSYKQLFESIDVFYKSIRAGINLKDRNKKTTFYFKSLLFLFYSKQNISWEKKAIKDYFQNGSGPSENSRIVKDIFGLSSVENWREQHWNISKENENIKRYSSPLLFKPLIFQGKIRIFLIMKKVPSIMKNQSFRISNGRNRSFPLLTVDEFNEGEFWRFVKNFKINNHVEAEFRTHKYFTLLSGIFESLARTIK